ncbi:MAG: radical SAM protein [Ignavibacteria bacterium]|jgi:MoaA/NifB/PqqE/SkfB family radical SAM enzyme|nr:radical SAM protein [Ignavibacteria bacterium]MCU7501802.1 radical SAM protein [Ignavibacteria bacterium]MCU7518277.1 radical SAM protein [Ignavibacteria bacterium]
MLLLCNYYVTYKCNASCEFCHFAEHEKFSTFPEASLLDFENNVRQLVDLGVKFIDLTGGEPLLNKNIAAMAGYARKLKMQTSITTNTLLYPKYADKLAGNISLLHFSMDSPDEDEHNKIRRVNCFKSIFKSIEIARSLGEYPDILFTATNENLKKLPRVYEISQKYGLVLIINPVFSYFGNPGLSAQAVEYLEEFIKGKMDVYLNRAFLELRKNGGNDIKKPSCRAVSRVIVISPDNKVILPCYHFANKAIPIDRPIKEIRNSEEIRLYRQMQGRFQFCQGCTVNCYFEPSFAFPRDIYSIQSLGSKLKYSYNKLIIQKIKKKFQH